MHLMSNVRPHESRRMQLIGDFAQAHEKVLRDTRNCLDSIKQVSAESFETVEAGIALLDRLRRESYEDLNQIQHEHMVLRSAHWLEANVAEIAGVEWSWNPRQTGDSSEPDLRGTLRGAVVISAEITTSERPVGTIENRMKSTLTKLAEFGGNRYYFVRTNAMAQRANTKVAKAGWSVRVVNLGA